MKFADDINSSINFLHIFGLIVLGNIYIDISISNKFAPFVELEQLLVYTF